MKGLSSARRRLLSLPVQAQRAADAAMQDAVQSAWLYARRVVPVRTGRLRASLHQRRDEGAVSLVTRCPYAVYVELGTRFARAQPYLVPAARQSDYFSRAADHFREVFK
ncbi:MAG: HK97 gp10 family phage protein [Clostridiales bacterium]|nr:HK97 gp10 family phage protein [Clostridiales bacterium]